MIANIEEAILDLSTMLAPDFFGGGVVGSITSNALLLDNTPYASKAKYYSDNPISDPASLSIVGNVTGSLKMKNNSGSPIPAGTIVAYALFSAQSISVEEL